MNTFIKVAAASHTTAVAGAIAGVIREDGKCEIQAVGAGALNRERQVRNFLSKLVVRGEDECWDWNAYKNESGYGVMGFSGKNQTAHRISYQLFCGDIPFGLCVLHTCDNPPCCNPKHLFLGTNLENIADRTRKGRSRAASGDEHYARRHPEKMARGDQHGSRTHPERRARGDRNGMRLHPEIVARGEGVMTAKLTESQVREIRQIRERGMSYSKIARQFNVCKRTIMRVVNRSTWRHVQ